MKRVTLRHIIAFTTLTISFGATAAAGDQTVFIGYSQANADWVKRAVRSNGNLYDVALQSSNVFGGDLKKTRDNNKSIAGGFIKYRYEFDNSWGAIVSADYLLGEYGNTIDRTRQSANGWQDDRWHYKNRVKADHFTLMAGPTYRINELLSIYGMLGFAYSHLGTSSNSHQFINGFYAERTSNSHDENNFSIASSVGLQVNVWKDLVVDTSYELSGSGDWQTSGFTVGLGYRF